MASPVTPVMSLMAWCTYRVRSHVLHVLTGGHDQLAAVPQHGPNGANVLLRPKRSDSVAYALGASLASEAGVVVVSWLVRRIQAQRAPNGIHDRMPR